MPSYFDPKWATTSFATDAATLPTALPDSADHQTSELRVHTPADLFAVDGILRLCRGPPGPLAPRQDFQMTRDGFSAALLRLGLPRSLVSFDGPGIGECYAIEHRSAGYVVYYSERGERRDEQAFDTESFALRYLLGWIIDHNS